MLVKKPTGINHIPVAEQKGGGVGVERDCNKKLVFWLRLSSKTLTLLQLSSSRTTRGGGDAAAGHSSSVPDGNSGGRLPRVALGGFSKNRRGTVSVKHCP